MNDDSLPEAEVEVRHYAGVLRQAVRAAGLSVTEVERRLGVGPKSLRRVFGGQVDLKFKHVVAVLRVIGMSQEEFFTLAIRRRQRSRAGGFLAAFRSAGYRGDFVPIPEDIEPPLSAEEFDRQVEEAVQRVLARRAEEGKPLLLEEPPPDEEGEPPPDEEAPPDEEETPPDEEEEGREEDGEGDHGNGGEPEQ